MSELTRSFSDHERIPLKDYAEKAYLDYSMYVVLDRALPNIGDRALLALIGVAAGAFGAHALKDRLSSDSFSVLEVGVRYQMYDASDGVVMIMCSEQAFWKNFCETVGRMDLFEKWPGSKYADHARNNRELQAELKPIFKTKTCQEWIDLGNEKNFPMAPVNTPENIVDDPQFQARFTIYPHEEHGADMISFPVHWEGEEMPAPTRAPAG